MTCHFGLYLSFSTSRESGYYSWSIDRAVGWETEESWFGPWQG